MSPHINLACAVRTANFNGVEPSSLDGVKWVESETQCSTGAHIIIGNFNGASDRTGFDDQTIGSWLTGRYCSINTELIGGKSNRPYSDSTGIK